MVGTCGTLSVVIGCWVPLDEATFGDTTIGRFPLFGEGLASAFSFLGVNSNRFDADCVRTKCSTTEGVFGSLSAVGCNILNGLLVGNAVCSERFDLLSSGSSSSPNA